MSSLIVEVSEGKLQGYESKTVLNQQSYYVFKRIPYAKPPVGALRFSNPEPPEPWQGVRDATRDCNICAQINKTTGVVIGDEDCLYLNVYTPALPGSQEALPVMVFIHPGGFVGGNATDAADYGPDYIIEKNVVLVGFNYRLGILGFLSLDCKEAPGNMGLKDQVQVLKWLKKNIGQFGGDPNNVTVFGGSAGSASVEYLLLSPMANGLFHKGIMHSGTSLVHWTRNEQTRELIMKIPQVKGTKITSDDELLKLLKNLPCEDLVTASMVAVKETTNWKGGFYFGFVPTIEKPGDWEPFLAMSPYKLLSRGEFSRVPVILGLCNRESLVMETLAPHLLEKLKNNKLFVDHLPFEIRVDQKTAVEKKLKSLYLESSGKHGEDEYAIDFFSDVDFISGIYVSASLISKYNPRVYLYEFAYSGKLNRLKYKLGIKSPGACHGDDLGYILSTEWLLGNDISDTDKSVRNRMVTLVTNFAKYGDPTPVVDDVITTKWKTFSGVDSCCLLVDDQLTMRPFAYQERAQFFTQLFKDQYPSQ